MAGELISKVNKEEWVRQARNLVEHFAEPLGMSSRKYLSTLPEFTPQPAEYRGRFDILVLVQTPTENLPLEKILEIVGIKYNQEDPQVLSAQDWKEGGFETPTRPYLTWMNDGIKNLYLSASHVRSHLLSDERGGNILDGIFLYFSNSYLLKDHVIELPGSQISSGHAPAIKLWPSGRPSLNYAHWTTSSSGDVGPVVAGRHIITRQNQGAV